MHYRARPIDFIWEWQPGPPWSYTRYGAVLWGGRGVLWGAKVGCGVLCGAVGEAVVYCAVL